MNESLVFAQFGLLATLAWQVYNRWAILSWSNTVALLLALAITLAAWTLTVNRPGNFRIVPEPKAQGHLITTGPYHWIRHPMYTSLLLMAAAWALLIDGWWAWFNWAALLVVLLFKLAVEEHLLKQHYRAYKDYQARTKRLIPWVF
jgi:protein-S-isoprenylcysteine O-methyltransferase Ste14